MISSKKVFMVEGLDEDFATEADAAAAAIVQLIGYDGNYVALRDTVQRRASDIQKHLVVLLEPKNASRNPR